MTIQQFHSRIRDYLNPGQGRYFTPATIDGAIQDAIDDFFRQDYKHFEETQEITDTLGYFKTPAQIQVSNGNIDLPADLHHVTDLEAVLSDGSKAPLIEIKDGMWAQRKNSVGYPPTAAYPICRQFGRKLEVLPVSGAVVVSSVNVLYLRKPATVKFNYTEASGYGFVFVAAGSVDPDWPSIDHTRLLMKALGYLGIPVDNRVALQAEQVKQISNQGA